MLSPFSLFHPFFPERNASQVNAGRSKTAETFSLEQKISLYQFCCEAAGYLCFLSSIIKCWWQIFHNLSEHWKLIEFFQFPLFCCRLNFFKDLILYTINAIFCLKKYASHFSTGALFPIHQEESIFLKVENSVQGNLPSDVASLGLHKHHNNVIQTR